MDVEFKRGDGKGAEACSMGGGRGEMEGEVEVERWWRDGGVGGWKVVEGWWSWRWRCVGGMVELVVRGDPQGWQVVARPVLGIRQVFCIRYY